MSDAGGDPNQLQQQQPQAPINIQQNQGNNPVPPPAPPPPVQAVQQPGQARRQRTKAGRWTVAHSIMMGNMSRNVPMTARDWEQRADTAVQGAEEIVREFNSKGRIGWFSRYRRRKAFKEKMELTQECRALQFNDPEPPVQTSLDLRMIASMMDDDTDYLDFKNDKDFISKFDENYSGIVRFAGIDPDILDTYLEANRPFLDEVGIHYSVDEIKAKASKFSKVEKFYRAKRDMIASPFYSILTGDDTEKIKDTDLRNLSAPQSTVRNGILKSYLKNVSELRDLKRDGVVRSGWENVSVSAVKKVSKKHGGTRGYFSVGNAKAGIKTTLKAGTTGSREHNVYDEKKTPIEKDLGEKVEASAKIEASAEANILEAGFKGKKRNKYGEGKWEGNITLGAVKAYGNIGGSLAFDPKKGKFKEWAGAEIGAEAAAVKAKLGASYSSHNDLHGAYVEAEGTALHASAYALAKVGTFKIPNTDGGEPIEIEDGFAVMAGAQAGLVKGSVSGGFKIFGIKIGATLSGTLGGAGAQVGIYKSKGKIGGTLGLAALVGVKLDINIDFSYWTNKIKEKLVKRIRHGKKS